LQKPSAYTPGTTGLWGAIIIYVLRLQCAGNNKKKAKDSGFHLVYLYEYIRMIWWSLVFNDERMKTSIKKPGPRPGFSLLINFLVQK
jgi:hypothetical protein